MIYGNINNLGNIKIYPKVLQRAIAYLQETDLKNKESGVYELQGKDMYVQVLDLDTEAKENRKPEIHRKYIDVQYLVSGAERIGFAVNCEKNQALDTYDEKKDILFYKNCEAESEIIMTPGSFAVFFTNIVHRPTCNDEKNSKIRKVVIKINKDLLSDNL